MMIPSGVTGRIAAGLTLAALLGVAAGAGGFTFVYAKGGSYFTDDPAACANCHIMQEQYAGWLQAGHRAVAVCNDCHTPHALVPKYWTKALNGYHHSYAFTTGDFREPIRITVRNRAITEQRCRDCHGAVVQLIERAGPRGGGGEGGERVSCIRCHRQVGHRR
jgi:cytochrome c nitrite reductase small subunit